MDNNIQEERLKALKERLIASGAISFSELAKLMKDTSIEANAAQILQWVKEHKLIYLYHNDKVYIPTCLLSEDGLEPNPATVPLTRMLMAAGDGGWSLWAWLVLPSPWLDGLVPVEALIEHTDKVLVAAKLRISHIRD